MSKNDTKNELPEQKDPDVILAPTLGDQKPEDQEDEQKDPLADIIDNETKDNTSSDEEPPEDKPSEPGDDVDAKKGDDKPKDKSKDKPADKKPVDKKDVKPTEPKPTKKEKLEPVFNENGDKKLTPEEVLAQLSLYDDFVVMRGWEITKFKFEFDRLVKADKILDIKETKKFLETRGHKV
jgi:hypothetical protein